MKPARHNHMVKTELGKGSLNRRPKSLVIKKNSITLEGQNHFPWAMRSLNAGLMPSGAHAEIFKARGQFIGIFKDAKSERSTISSLIAHGG